MHTVKGRENESNIFGEGWRAFSPTFPPSKRRMGGIWRAAADPWRSRGRGGGGKEREGGGEGACAGSGHWPCCASACGATGTATSSPPWRSAGSDRQRGHPVAPHALARQWLTIAPVQVARPNGLRLVNKKQYGLNLKY